MRSTRTRRSSRSYTAGLLCILASALLFSTGGVLIKAVPWSALSISCCRSIFAAMVLYVYLRASGKNLAFNRSILVGAVLNYGMLQTFVLATKLTTAANAIVLQFTQPVWVILLTWIIFKERPRTSSLLTCGVVFAGMAFSFADRLNPEGLAGNLLAVVSGIFYAGVFLIKKLPNSDFECSAILSFAACALTGLPSLLSEQAMSGSYLMLTSLQGVLQCGAAYIFLSKGLDTVSPVTASLTSIIEPVLNPLWVALFLGETIGPLAIIGLILVLGASTAYNVKTARTTA